MRNYNYNYKQEGLKMEIIDHFMALTYKSRRKGVIEDIYEKDDIRFELEWRSMKAMPQIEVRFRITKKEEKIGVISYWYDASTTWRNEDFEIFPLWEKEAFEYTDENGNVVEQREVKEEWGCFARISEAARDEKNKRYNCYSRRVNDKGETWSQPIV